MARSPIWLTLLSCNVVGLICGPPHGGYLLVTAARMDKTKLERSRRVILKLALWLLTIGVFPVALIWRWLWRKLTRQVGAVARQN